MKTGESYLCSREKRRLDLALASAAIIPMGALAVAFMPLLKGKMVAFCSVRIGLVAVKVAGQASV